VVSRECRRGFYELRHFGALCVPTSLSPTTTWTSGGGSTGSDARWAENVGTFRSGWAESGLKAVQKGADLQGCPANRTSIAMTGQISDMLNMSGRQGIITPESASGASVGQHLRGCIHAPESSSGCFPKVSEVLYRAKAAGRVRVLTAKTSDEPDRPVAPE